MRDYGLGLYALNLFGKIHDHVFQTKFGQLWKQAVGLIYY